MLGLARLEAAMLGLALLEAAMLGIGVEASMLGLGVEASMLGLTGAAVMLGFGGFMAGLVACPVRLPSWRLTYRGKGAGMPEIEL